MSRPLEILLVAIYNLALLAGASYLYLEKGVTGWIYLLALVFAASWKTEKGDAING